MNAATWVNVDGVTCDDVLNSRWAKAWRIFNRTGSRAAARKAQWYADEQQRRIIRSENEAVAAGVPQPW